MRVFKVLVDNGSDGFEVFVKARNRNEAHNIAEGCPPRIRSRKRKKPALWFS